MAIFKKTVTEPETSAGVLAQLDLVLASAVDLAGSAKGLAEQEHQTSTAMAQHFAGQAVEADARKQTADALLVNLSAV
jgi:hypothetical protein